MTHNPKPESLGSIVLAARRRRAEAQRVQSAAQGGSNMPVLARIERAVLESEMAKSLGMKKHSARQIAEFSWWPFSAGKSLKYNKIKPETREGRPSNGLLELTILERTIKLRYRHELVYRGPQTNGTEILGELKFELMLHQGDLDMRDPAAVLHKDDAKVKLSGPIRPMRWGSANQQIGTKDIKCDLLMRDLEGEGLARGTVKNLIQQIESLYPIPDKLKFHPKTQKKPKSNTRTVKDLRGSLPEEYPGYKLPGYTYWREGKEGTWVRTDPQGNKEYYHDRKWHRPRNP